MAKRDLKNTPPAGDESKDSTERGGAPKLTAFAKQMRKRYGKEIDPHVSLDGDETPPEENLEKGSTPAKQRLERLANLTPGDFRYEYRREIGRGGMGVVLKVRDRDLQRSLAMKVLMSKSPTGTGSTPTDHRKLTRFLEEAQITGQLNHPGVVPVHELGMDARGRPFFTMRLVRGHTLKDVFQVLEKTHKHQGLDGWNLNRALAALLRVCETIAFAHSKEVIHRDLKPSNIMVGEFGETYVMDWGLAKIIGREEERNIAPMVHEDESVNIVRTDRRTETDMDPTSPLVTMDGDVVGTPAYMAPEQAKGQLEKVGTQSDVYSIGAILYHLLTGQPPYADADKPQNPHVILMRVLSGPPEKIHKLRKGIPVELAAICEKAMQYSRKKRYKSISALSTDLQAYLEGYVVVAHETGSIAEFKKWVERNSAMATVSALAIITLISLLGRFSYLKSARNDELTLANGRITALNETEAQARKDSDENARFATEAMAKATSANDENVRIAYFAGVNAAHLSLRLNETAVARELLSTTAGELAGWEWDHVNLFGDTSLQVWETGYGQESRVALSRDGKWVASAERSPGKKTKAEHSIEIRSSATGALEKSFPAPDGLITGLRFDDSGDYLAASSTDRIVRVINLPTESFEDYNHSTADSAALGMPGGSVVNGIAFGPGGKLVCATAKLGVQIWDTREVERGKRIKPIRSYPNEEELTCVDMSPNGKLVAAGGKGGTAYIWGLVEDGASSLYLGEMELTAVSFDRSSSTLAVCSKDGSVRIALLRNGKATIVAVRRIEGAYPTDCVYFPDGRIMVSCSDGLLRLINLASPSIATIQGHTSYTSSISMDGEGIQIASASKDGTIRLWSRLTFLPTTLFSGHEGNVSDLLFSMDGSIVATAGRDRTIRLWNSTTAEATHVMREVLRSPLAQVNALAFSPNGEYLASGSGSRGGDKKSEIVLWDPKTGELDLLFEHHNRYITDLCFSPDGRILAVASGDKTCSLWDIDQEALFGTIDFGDKRANSLVWNPSGTRLLVALEDGQVQEWDPYRTDAPIRSFDLGSKNSVLSLCYAADGTQFVAGCLDASIQVWDLAGGLLRKLTTHGLAIQSVDLSPDGKRLVSRSQDGSAILWDTKDWTPALTLKPRNHESAEIYGPSIQDARFSPDGKRILTADGRTALIWETEPPSTRHAAMVLAQDVGDMVNGLFDEIGSPSDILEALSRDRNLTGDYRRAAIILVGLFASDPELQAKRSWEVIMESDETPKAYENALGWAQHALQLEPESKDYKNAVASALYRTGEYESALESLQELMEESLENEAEPHPAGTIFLAMAAYQTGATQLAASTLEDLNPLMLHPRWERLAGGLFDEAKALILQGD